MSKEQPICGIRGCSRETLARGVCKLHYRRWQANRKRWNKYQIPTVPRTQCNNWDGENFSDKRPCFHWRDITTRAKTKVHAMRAGLLIELGPLGDPGDLEAAHGCHNPLCVNTLHGFWATRQENMSGKVPESVKQYLPPTSV